MERKKIVVIIIVIIALLLFFFPKLYARSGGLAGVSKSAECDCIGWKYEYYPEGCADCFTSYYCSGITYNCKEICNNPPCVLYSQ